MRKSGKTAVITGASSGVGKCLCNYLAAREHKIIALARNEKRLKELIKNIEETGGEATYYAFDIRNTSALKKAADDIEKKFNNVDILINNAGVNIDKTFESLSYDEIDEVIDTNLKGYIHTTRSMIPLMKGKDGYKYIFNISSMAGERGIEGNGLYQASKFGVNGFGNTLSKYLIKYNIHVVTLCPGGINTPWYDTHEWKFDPKTLIEPDEIARLIGFILDGRKSTIFQKVLFFPSSVIDRW